MLFSFHYTSESIVSTIIAFILFSLLASSVYIFNDIMDIEEDKNHPTKRFRPLASGMIDKKYAIIMICILAIPSLVLGFFVNTQLAGILSSYFLLNFIYSIKLKHIAIVDIFIIASGFVLRLFAGAVVIEVHLSIWLIIMTFLLALFLALAKRRDDVLLASEGKATRKNIDGYNLEFVNSAMGLMSAVIIVSYILYTISEEVIDRLGTPYLYLTT
ncbi:MAG: UbiA prenyltransferase family protein, partial [Candidatus Marinimicrobia bacterium]|nr:UbiA prenyltransferase family protein [Candidatus Neomarinimicrobiota bacterium]